MQELHKHILSNVDDLAINQRNLRVGLHKPHNFKHLRVQILLFLTRVVPYIRLQAFLLQVFVNHLPQLVRHHLEGRTDQLLNLELAIASLPTCNW